MPRRVVSSAGEHLGVRLFYFHLNLAEGAVAFRIGGIVPKYVLRAKLFGNFIERFFECFRIVDVDHASACIVRHLLRDARPGITETAKAINAGIRNQKYVNHCVSALCSLHRVLHAEPAALIYCIGQNNHRFAPRFRREFVVASQVNRIVEDRPPPLFGIVAAVPPIPAAGAFITVLRIARSSTDTSCVKSAIKLASRSKLITIVKSLGRITWRKNRDAASCSAGRTRSMLPLVSISSPSVIGRSTSFEK